MAFFSKVGALLRQTASNQMLNSEICASKPSLFQAIRCMSSMASSKLFVGGLSYATDDFQLREAFGKYGQVVEARVIVDRETGRSRGFGFVTFTSSEEASAAIQGLDGQPLYGRNVRVNYANERTRGFGGGGYRSNYGAPGGGYGDNFGANFGGGNYGPSGGSYGGNYGPPGGSNYGGDGGSNFGGGNYQQGGGSGYSGATNYSAGGQYAGGNTFDGVAGSGNTFDGVAGSGNTFDSVAGGGGGSTNFDDSNMGGGFEGSPDFSLGNGDQMGTDATDSMEDSTGGYEQSDMVDGNFRDDDDDDLAKRA